jgi:hypothetical protein
MAYYPNDILTPHFLTGAIQERPTRESIRQQYISQTLLPWRTVPERRLTWDSLAAENNLAGFYGTKGEPIPGDDVMFASHFANLIDVMATRHLDHDIINSVRAPGMAAVYKAGGAANPIQGLRQRFEDHVRNNLAWCDDTVDAQVEYMVVKALSDGTITWPPTTAAGAAITPPMPHWNATMTVSVSMGLDANFVQNATTLTGYSSRPGTQVAWNSVAGTQNPVFDLEVIAAYMTESKGLNTANMLMYLSRDTLSQIAFSTTVLQWIRGKQYETPQGRNFVEASALKEFIQTRLGFEIRLYDAQWTYRSNIDSAPPTVNRVKFLKEGKVIILPKAEMDSLGYMATTYHKDGSGNFVAGKYTWMHEDDEPPFLHRLGVGLVAFPVLEQAGSIFVLDSYS